MAKTHFDYIIIGNGLAGFQLALALAQDSFFKDKHIALIDKDLKNTNDKTWSFWEKEQGQWDTIVAQTWDNALFYSSEKKLELSLKPYKYKSIHAIDFYNFAKAELTTKANFHFIQQEALSIEENALVSVTTEAETYTSNHVFDSRIPNEYFSELDNYTRIQQHFKGWIIETKNNVFNTNTFTMMDYRLKDGNQTTFMYVLPYSENKALVEFTYFTTSLVEEDVYNDYLKKYITNQLNITDYNILETEKGNIPMTTFPFKSYSTKQITKIGTAGGWVKGSTGYSFKHTEKKVAQIISNLKQGKTPSKGLIRSKYAFYDKIFLKVLEDENHLGEWVFEQFYTKNSVEDMFKFLDEESSFKEELKIMKSLFSSAFIKAFFKTL